MARTRTHHYAIEQADLDEFLARRAGAISAVRDTCPGLTSTRLIRQDDGSYTDTWRWESAEKMAAALAAMPLPEVRAAMSLVRDHEAVDGEVVDER